MPLTENRHAVSSAGMKAVRLTERSRPLELHDIAIPPFESHEVLVKVRAAGICHSDVHYRAGTATVEPLPLTLGHEVAGVVEEVGSEVRDFAPGDRVCLHYLVTCGTCRHCQEGHEQFCPSSQMLGKDRDGGYAEWIALPARGVFPLPEEVSFEWGAVMMCSSATSLHALRKARLEPGESVAVFGVGGLGMSAVQLAFTLGASVVYAVDIDPERLALGERLGAVPVDAAAGDPVERVRALTDGRGVDVALELIGLPLTMRQSVQCLAYRGRSALAGITDRDLEVSPYSELIGTEAEIIGVSDHLATEIVELTEFARTGKLDLGEVITSTVPLEAKAINEALDNLERFGAGVRTVIVP
jgi:D-arabinose 1-dehydrogenase-like Zn-dependent alcohol dehydrogenase